MRGLRGGYYEFCIINIDVCIYKIDDLGHCLSQT